MHTCIALYIYIYAYVNSRTHVYMYFRIVRFRKQITMHGLYYIRVFECPYFSLCFCFITPPPPPPLFYISRQDLPELKEQNEGRALA